MAVPSVVVVVAARQVSKRLPNKVLEDMNGLPMLFRVLSRASLIRQPVRLSVPEDTEWPAWVKDPVVPGPENDLIKRHLLASEGFEHVVRVTGDCPFLDPFAARCTIHTHLEGGYDLTIDEAEGRGVQVYTRALLELLDRDAQGSYGREHLDVWPLKWGYRQGLVVHRMKFSVDTQAELELARARVIL